jgi:hypothetical protein
MKNESNAGNLQRDISGICAFALGLIVVTCLPAGAVTPTVLSGDCSPGNAVAWPRPVGTAGVASNGFGYIGTRAFTVNAIPYNPYCKEPDRSNWRNNQQIQIDWWVYWWNSGQNRWDALNLGNNGGTASYDWVNAYGPNSSYKIPQHYKQISRNYTYALALRIAWINNERPMAAATYWFDQYGDLACEPGWYKCTLLYPPNGASAPTGVGAPHTSIQALHLY